MHASLMRLWIWDRPPHRGLFTNSIWVLERPTGFNVCERVVWHTYGFLPISEKTRKSNRLQMSLLKRRLLFRYFIERPWMWNQSGFQPGWMRLSFIRSSLLILVPCFESTNSSLLGKCAQMWNFDRKYLPFTSIAELFYNYWKTLFVGL